MKKINKLTLQKWLPIKEINKEGVVKLKNNKLIKIIKVNPINYNLKSNLEKESILNSYKIFLKTCNFNIQILIQSNKEDLNNHISKIKKNISKKENKIFDLKLDKYINKVEIKNSTGVQIASYDKEKLAKVEIAAKQLDNSTVTVEYQIEVTNEGEIPGYANEIIDYIPSDLTFSKELNKDWNKNSDGTVTSTNLKNTIINAGETKTLTLVLTKKMTKDTTGTSINIAEIKESSNDYAIEDKDSIAGNKKDKEDDMSSAQLIISVKTGTTIAYIGLSIMLIITLGAGLYFIKAKVLKK